MKTTVLVKAEEFGLQEQDAKGLLKGLDIPLKERDLLEKEFEVVSKLDITDKKNIKTFKALRLKVVKNRTQGIMKWHKNAKDYFLKGGQFVDAIKRKELLVNEQMETKLMEAEKYFENLEIERIKKLQEKRLTELQQLNPEFQKDDLGEMTDDEYEVYLEGFKALIKKRKEQEEKERIEKELQDLLDKREKELLPYSDFITDKHSLTLQTTVKEFEFILSDLKKAKKEYLAKQEKIKKENEKLKKDQEKLEKQRLAEQEEAKKKEQELQKKQKQLEQELKKAKVENKSIHNPVIKKTANTDKAKLREIYQVIDTLIKTEYTFESELANKVSSGVIAMLTKTNEWLANNAKKVK